MRHPGLGVAIVVLVVCTNHRAYGDEAVANAAPAPVAPTPDAQAKPRPPKPPRTYGVLSAGVSTGSRGAIICAEVAPLSFLSVAGCGNGSGFLHHDAAPDISHWRFNVTLASLKASAFWFQPRLQLGFAEVQVGQDTPGFQFTKTNEIRTATAGVEAGASVRGVWPIGKSQFEVLSELGVGVAYVPHAPNLVVPQAKFIPSVLLTIGVGF